MPHTLLTFQQRPPGHMQRHTQGPTAGRFPLMHWAQATAIAPGIVTATFDVSNDPFIEQ